MQLKSKSTTAPSNRPSQLLAVLALGVGLTGCARTIPQTSPFVGTLPPPVTTGQTLTSTTTGVVPTSPVSSTSSVATSISVVPSSPDTTPSNQFPDDDYGSLDEQSSPAGGTMSFDAVSDAVNPYGDLSSVETVASGDIDADGDEDVVVLAGMCGASCGSSLKLVLNVDTVPVVYDNGVGDTFAPWYVGGGAAQTGVEWVDITGNTIVVTATRLCGDTSGMVEAPWPCNDVEPAVTRTATYQYDNGAVVPVSIEPPLG